ncbi:Hypothetical protein R9X50_00776700 [Acrodontium crateriforme]|uniref:Conserved oligomeric Golgi complex subunit 4 n=1 Tax=Acrodontium crateriforme TaxID=150365 RepID=A0AAQ3MBR3_9PEZI|nr:Hypothetical protein R9X50_00776700 [Acrodontium crateriforme]
MSADDLHVDSHRPSPAANIYTASSIQEIRDVLTELGKREATVNARLDDLLATQKDLSRHLARLDLARAQLGSQVVATRAIGNGMLSSAASTAHRLSAAVKRLDQEQAAVKATLQVVEQVAELKACILGVHGSMSAPQDWETAATYLYRASQIPDSVIDGAFAEEIVPTAEVPDAPRQTINAAAESLCGLFLREFESAAKEGDGARVTRFFKLFPLIGRSDVGLEAYGRYVCSGIAARARSNMNTTQRRDGLFYANALTKLFEHIAQIVDGHEPLVERHYGVGSMTKVVERIQVEADSQGGLILDTWADERHISRKLTDIKSYPFTFLVQSFMSQKPSTNLSRTGSPTPAGTTEDDSVDMKEIDALLNEGAIMLGRWSLYVRFLASKTNQLDEDDEATPLTIPAFITHSTLQKKVQDLLVEPFNLMATFFFRRSVEKSFQLDEPPSELTLNPTKPLTANPPFITSAVDDVMYMVNQVLQRTLSTSQRSVIASVLPSISRVLGSDFYGMIQRRMRDESYPKAAIQGALPPESLIISFLVQINNLDIATDYVRRIIRTSLGQPQQSQPQPQIIDPTNNPIIDAFPFASEAIFVTKALQNIESTFSQKTTELITEAVEVMLKQVMRPRLRPVLAETFRDIDYTTAHHNAAMNSSDDESDHEELVVARFERGWQAFTLPLKRIVTPHTYALLLNSTTLHLSRTLEKRLWALRNRVSPLGAIRLERDIAGIVAAAVKGGPYELRDGFARCMQITLLISMEDEEWSELEPLDGKELEAVSGVSWVLDRDERKRARAIVDGEK